MARETPKAGVAEVDAGSAPRWAYAGPSLPLPDLDDAALRRYLLGTLSEPEVGALELAYLAYPELRERVQAEENRLREDHAAGRLASGDQERFERRYGR